MVTVAEPTFEATQQMMAHPRIAVLAITGGPGIVAMGMKSGKSDWCWRGQPPSSLMKPLTWSSGGGYHQRRLVRLQPALHCRKSLIVVESVAERLVQQMQTFGALLLSPADTDKLPPPACRKARPIKAGRKKAHRLCWKQPGSPFRRKRRAC